VENLEKESRAGGGRDGSGDCREQGLVLTGRWVAEPTGSAGTEDLAAGELQVSADGFTFLSTHLVSCP